MDATDQAAEQIVRMTLAGSEVALRLTGAGAKNLAAALMAAAANTEKTKGKTRLVSLLKTGKELKVFPIPANKLNDFAAEAKRYGVLYVVVKQDGGETIDLMVKAEDASKINRIIEHLKLGHLKASHKATPAIAKDNNEQNATLPKTETQDAQAAENLLGELLGTPHEQEQKQPLIPLGPTPEKKTPSEPTSGRKQPSEKASENKPSEKQARQRESVRSRLRTIEHERKAAASLPKEMLAPTPASAISKQVKAPKGISKGR